MLRRIAVFIKQLILPADKMHNSLDSDIRTVFPYYFFAKKLLRPGRGAECCDEGVCLSVCLSVYPSVRSIYQEPHAQTSLIFLCMFFSCGRGSGLLWRCCNMVGISGFTDGVVFSYNRPYGGVMQCCERNNCVALVAFCTR